MNLYKYHNKPESLKHHDKTQDHIPEVFFDDMHNTGGPNKHREKAIGKSLDHTDAYLTSHKEFKTFPEGEDIIAKHPDMALYYARDNLKKRWPKAEPAILKNGQWAKHYMIEVIKGPWPEAKEIINKFIPTSYKRALQTIQREKND